MTARIKVEKNKTFTAYVLPMRSLWARQARSFSITSFRQLSRHKIAMFWSLVWPVIWYLGFSIFVIERSGSASIFGQTKAVTTVAIGMFGALTVSLSIFSIDVATDLEYKRYRKLRSLPIKPSADIFGRFAAGLAMSLVSYLIVLVVGYVDGARFAIEPLSVPVFLLSFFLLSIIGMSLGIVVTSFVVKPGFVNMLTFFGVIVLFFASGFNGIRPGILPSGFGWLVNYLPHSLATRIQVAYLTDVPVDALTPPALPESPRFLAILVVYGLLFVAFGKVAMDRIIYGSEAGE